jgi:probable HAF family extracellular repeat protein
MRRTILGGLTALLLVAPSVHRLGAEAPLYSVQDLGTIDGFAPTATGINAAGEVSGFVSGAAGARAVRYRNGGWSYVPGLENVMSVANAINDSGDVTGYHFLPTGVRAFRYTEATHVVDVLDPLPGGSLTIGMAINNLGDVVGYGNTPQGTRAWRSTPGLPPLALPTLGGSFGLACGINDHGQVTGTSSVDDLTNTQHAFRLEMDGSVTDLGTFDGPEGTSSACGIDGAGRVTGRATNGGVNHAFRFTGALADLDAFGGAGSGAEGTSNGTTVGSFTLADGFTSHAFVHTVANGSVDLNSRIPADSGWVLTSAKAVNANGQIVGQGIVNGEVHAYLLTPLVPRDTTAPTIAGLAVNPSSIFPPNNAVVPVAVSVSASDDRDAEPVCSVVGIDGHGAPATDFAVTGAFTGSVRAVGGATYTFTVSCVDAAGNHSEASANVVVPPDTTAPVISRVSASPYLIWPPNGKMVPVSLSVNASDDVDAFAKCGLTEIASSSFNPTDAAITGAFSAMVRAEKDRSYTLHVTCVDTAGNASSATVSVRVGKEGEVAKYSSKRDVYVVARRVWKELVLARR